MPAALAWAALADLGNKVFVLIILYSFAMSWYLEVHRQSLEVKQEGNPGKAKFRSLLISLVQEPVNLVIVLAILLLAFRQGLQNLPLFVQDAVVKTSSMLTPLVLLFIGLSVNLSWAKFFSIGRLLVLRSGIAFLLSAVLIFLLPLSLPMAMLAIIFPQSSASFWPIAHMSAFTSLELKNGFNPKQKTFDLDIGLNVLAVSMPFSTIMVLAICTLGNWFANPWVPFVTGLLLIFVSSGSVLFSTLLNARKQLLTSKPLTDHGSS